MGTDFRHILFFSSFWRVEKLKSYKFKISFFVRSRTWNSKKRVENIRKIVKYSNICLEKTSRSKLKKVKKVEKSFFFKIL